MFALEARIMMLEVMTLQMTMCNVIMRQCMMQCIEMIVHTNECLHFGHKRVAKLTDSTPKKRSSFHVEPCLVFPCHVVKLVLHVYILWVILMGLKVFPNHLENNFSTMQFRSESILLKGLWSGCMKIL